MPGILTVQIPKELSSNKAAADSRASTNPSGMAALRQILPSQSADRNTFLIQKGSDTGGFIRLISPTLSYGIELSTPPFRCQKPKMKVVQMLKGQMLQLRNLSRARPIVHEA